MSRILSLFLFLLLSPLAIPAQAQPTPAAQTRTESAQLRTLAHTLLATGKPDDALKAAELFDKASLIDARQAETLKNEAERKKLEQPSPDATDARWKTVAGAVTPLLTTIILAGTLIFQVFQARVTEREKREDTARQQDNAEKTRLADALELIQKSEDISPAATLINTFTTEPYRTSARRMGSTILLRSKSFDKFTDLFTSVMDPVTPETLPQCLELLRSVHNALDPLMTLTYHDGINDTTKLTETQLAQFTLLRAERTFLSAKIAPVLRQWRTGMENLNLRSLGFDVCDLSGTHLQGTALSPAAWNYVNMDDCDLSGITDFKYVAFYNMAWWHASRIDKPFLDYLKNGYPFTPAQVANSPIPISREEYESNIARLERLLI